ncbi:MAG: type II toxin-antitoxin system Phd/YefM family antitoxin [Microgenomates group bacterium]
MQTKVYSAYEARNKFGEILNLVYYQGAEIIVEKMKKPIVKIVPLPDVKPLSKKSYPPLLKYYGAFKSKKRYSIKKIEEIAKEGFVKSL